MASTKRRRGRRASAGQVLRDGASHGYVRCDADEPRWRADFRSVATVLAPSSPVQTLATFEIADREPGAMPA